MAGESIREWLDEVKSGFGAKFASAFEEVGIEDKSDLHDLDEEAMAALELELQAVDAKIIHLKKIKKAIEAIVAPASSARAKLETAKEHDARSAELAQHPAVVAAKERRGASAKPFAAFLSHHKLACAMEARFLKSELERVLGSEIFLDSDDLKDLRELGKHVVDSDALVLLQSSEVLLRPWCIFELCKAIDTGIPIVAVTITSKGYEFAQAGKLMLHLDTLLEVGNPGASKVLVENGIDLKVAAWKLSSTIPNVISVDFNPSGSQNNIMGSLLDLLEGLNAAHPVAIEQTFDEWLAARGDAPVSAEPHGSSKEAHGQNRSLGTPLPPEVPDLPRGYLVREAILDGIKAILFPPSAEAGAESKPLGAQPVTVVQGMGGSGKTVTAAALVFDTSVRSRFDVVCFVSFGQAPVLRDLQKVLYFQLVGRVLNSGLSSEEVLKALAEGAKGKNVLCVLDDVWTKEAFQPFSRLLDDSTSSHLVATTRVKGLVPGAAEFELGLLSPEYSVRLLLECAGEKAVEPFPQILYDAVELCGRLPLVISIAAGILEQQHGGVVDEAFIALLSEDHGEVLREGEHGDEMVSIEDRLINASLNSYTGKDKNQVEQLFLEFAIFPEDVPVPLPVFDALAPMWAGRETKRPHLKVRSWVTALVRCSLAVGSLADGVYQHGETASRLQFTLFIEV